MRGTIPPLPQYAFMAWCSVYLYLYYYASDSVQFFLLAFILWMYFTDLLEDEDFGDEVMRSKQVIYWPVFLVRRCSLSKYKSAFTKIYFA
jgi:hypothetical protein